MRTILYFMNEEYSVDRAVTRKGQYIVISVKIVGRL